MPYNPHGCVDFALCERHMALEIQLLVLNNYCMGYVIDLLDGQGYQGFFRPSS